MTINVKVERTAKVTIVLDEMAAAALASLIGKVAGEDALMEIYQELLRQGLTPPRFVDRYVLRRDGIFAKGSEPRCPHGYTGSPAAACTACLPSSCDAPGEKR